jgi:hypothetical protein
MAGEQAGLRLRTHTVWSSRCHTELHIHFTPPTSVSAIVTNALVSAYVATCTRMHACPTCVRACDACFVPTICISTCTQITSLVCQVSPLCSLCTTATGNRPLSSATALLLTFSFRRTRTARPHLPATSFSHLLDCYRGFLVLILA